MTASPVFDESLMANPVSQSHTQYGRDGDDVAPIPAVPPTSNPNRSSTPSPISQMPWKNSDVPSKAPVFDIRGTLPVASPFSEIVNAATSIPIQSIPPTLRPNSATSAKVLLGSRSPTVGTTAETSVGPETAPISTPSSSPAGSPSATNKPSSHPAVQKSLSPNVPGESTESSASTSSVAQSDRTVTRNPSTAPLTIYSPTIFTDPDGSPNGRADSTETRHSDPVGAPASAESSPPNTPERASTGSSNPTANDDGNTGMTESNSDTSPLATTSLPTASPIVRQSTKSVIAAPLTIDFDGTFVLADIEDVLYRTVDDNLVSYLKREIGNLLSVFTLTMKFINGERLLSDVGHRRQQSSNTSAEVSVTVQIAAKDMAKTSAFDGNKSSQLVWDLFTDDSARMLLLALQGAGLSMESINLRRMKVETDPFNERAVESDGVKNWIALISGVLGGSVVFAALTATFRNR